MSDLRDNTLPTTPSPAAEPVDATGGGNTIDPVTATTPPQTEVKLDQSVPTIDPLPVTPPNPFPESNPEPTPPTPSITITPTMGDDTPLAFASKPSSETQVNETVQPTTESVPPSIGSSYLPPTPPVAPAPNPTSETPKKKMGSKIMMLVVGLVLLGSAVAGGLYYVNNFSTTPQIAVLDQSCYDRCRETKGHQVCTCNCGGACTRPDSGSPTPAPVGGVKTCSGGTCTCSGNYTYCGGAIDKCIPTAEIAAAGGGCNTYGEVVYGIPTTYGANASRLQPGQSCDPVKVANQSVTQCTCGSNKYCFDRRGECNIGDTVDRTNGTTVNMGLCGIVGSTNTQTGVWSENSDLFNPDGTMRYQFNCDMNGCSTTDASCVIVRYTCNESKTNQSCIDNPTAAGNNYTFEGKCGTIEQIDVSCGTGLPYVTSRTRINPPCQPGESAPPITTTPTMACTGLTRSPNTASPAIGDTLTFTCTGTVTPASAGTLSYKFRYKIGSGAVTPLTNKTTTTAELTLAACGTYTVECQACSTLNGVLKCDPQWVGATQ